MPFVLTMLGAGGDPLVVGPADLAALGFLAILGSALAPLLRGTTSAERMGLAAIVIVGAGLRMAFGRQLLMGVNDYARDVPLLFWAEHHHMGLLGLFPDGMHRIEVTGWLNKLISFVLPLLLYAHGRLAFPTGQVPLHVALLIAVSPPAIAFSGSNVEFISSMFFSSSTLVLLHSMVVAPSARRAAVLAVGLATAFVLTIDARPENITFGAIVPAALVVTRERSRSRGVTIAAMSVLLVIAAVFAQRLLTHGSTTAAPGAGVPGSPLRLIEESHTYWRAFVESNNYLTPSRMPLAFTLLAAAGGMRMLVREPGRFAYVALWFGLLYSAHALVEAKTQLLAMRYSLHTLVPVCFAAAYGLDGLASATAQRFRGTRLYAVGALLVAAALATVPQSLGLFRLPEDEVQQEYRFLTGVWQSGAIEPGATVVESYGPPPASRFAVFGERLRGARFRVEVTHREALSDEAGPVYLYNGLPCLWRRDEGQEIAKTCLHALASADWKLVKDFAITGPTHDPAAGKLAAGGKVALYRLERK